MIEEIIEKNPRKTLIAMPILAFLTGLVGGTAIKYDAAKTAYASDLAKYCQYEEQGLSVDRLEEFCAEKGIDFQSIKDKHF
jgi:hypothetical protein